MALGGETFSSEVYAFIVVFVLPVNSALNPFMYTFSNILARKVSIHGIISKYGHYFQAKFEY